MTRGLENMAYEERLKEFAQLDLEKRQQRGGPEMILKYFKDRHKENGSESSSMSTTGG